MAPCSQDLLGLLTRKDQTWSLWTPVSFQMLMLEEWTKLPKSSLPDETSCSFPFLPNTSSARQHGLSQHRMCCRSVEEVASSKQQWVNAVVKEKKQDWPVSLVCSLHGECVTHALDAHLTLPCSCAASHVPTESCAAGLLVAWDPTVAAGLMTSHPAWLERGVTGQEKCWGVVQKEASALEESPKNVSPSNIFMPKSIILSHGQEWMWDLILWDSKELGKGGGNLSLSAFLILQTCPLLSCGFFPFLLPPAPRCRCRGRGAPLLSPHLFSG